MLISGPTSVCVGTTETYSLPTMPGTFYNWTVSGGGGVIVGPNQNTPTITVQWNGPVGPATITCNYNNPYSGCFGSSTLTVNVKNKFNIGGPSTTCAGNNTNYFVSPVRKTDVSVVFTIFNVINYVDQIAVFVKP